MTDRRWASPREAAKALGLGLGTCYKYLYSGEIPGARLGRSWLVDVAELERRLERQIRDRRPEGPGRPHRRRICPAFPADPCPGQGPEEKGS